MLPVSYTEIDENKDISYSAGPPMTTGEERAVRSLFGFINQVEAGDKEVPQYFISALRRFSSSFRVRQIEQNIVDLIVALESLFNVQPQELRRRLATIVALSLGVNNGDRKRIYQTVSAGYVLRNAIVHGQQKPSNALTNALARFDINPYSFSNDDIKNHLWVAEREVREIVRKALRAYIYMESHGTLEGWPQANDFDDLQFDPQKLRQVRRHLGVNRI